MTMNPSHRVALVGSVVVLAAFLGGTSAQPTGTSCTSDSGCGVGEFCHFRDFTCSGQGECWNPPQWCTAIFDPVCGCDGVTYSSICQANAHGHSVRTKGECPTRHLAANQPPRQSQEGAGGATRRCGGVTKLACLGEDHYCKFTEGSCGDGDDMGDCQPMPTICTMIYRPVCGCNGKEYSSDCVAASQGVSIRHYGTCGDNDGTPSK